ncbi:hypothetical protein V3C99_015320, partial [Haemonchus contortus]
WYDSLTVSSKSKHQFVR